MNAVLASKRQAQIDLAGLYARGKREDNGCLLWMGGKTNGYGKVYWKGKGDVNVRRLVLMTVCNLTTLPKTFASNNEGQTCPRTCFELGHLSIGGQSPLAKLTDIQARIIKHSKYPKTHSEYLSTPERAKKYSEEFGISISHEMINNIDKCTTYLHIPDREGNLPKKKEVPEFTEEMWLEAEKRVKKRSKVSDHLEYNGSKCWMVDGYRDKCGYGKIRIFGCRFYSHLLSCAAKERRFPNEGEDTLHACDRPPCINPDHLSFDTHSRNAKDSRDSGTNKSVKLSIQKADEIKALFTAQQFTQNELAAEYGVKAQCISNVLKGKTWNK